MTQQETEFEKLLVRKGIRFTSGREARATRIDYHLTDYDLLVELKTWESDRLAGQLKSISGRSILVLVGPKSVAAFENLLNDQNVSGYFRYRGERGED